jgi:hypothetical protein
MKSIITSQDAKVLQEAIQAAHKAMDPDEGSNDGEHEALYAFVEIAGSLLLANGYTVPEEVEL